MLKHYANILALGGWMLLWCVGFLIAWPGNWLQKVASERAAPRIVDFDFDLGDL